MSGRSRVFRANVESDGAVLCDDGTAIPCVIRSISLQGAKIQFGPHMAIPEEFRLMSDDLALKSEAWIVWRFGNTAGVRFRDPIEIGSF